MNQRHHGLYFEPIKHNTPKEQNAERMNSNESKRLVLQTRYFMRQKHASAHVLDQRINRTRGLLDQITLSTGNLSSQELLSGDVAPPCFMYGERVESRRRYGKRMALLRFFLERRPKSPQGKGKSLQSKGSHDFDSRTPDEIFNEILQKIESESEQEDNDDDEDASCHVLESKKPKARVGSAVVHRQTERLSAVQNERRRPKTAPSWESQNQSPVLPRGNPAWTSSSSSIHDIGMSGSHVSPRIQLLMGNEESSTCSSSQRDLYTPFWADLGPVTPTELRSSRGRTPSARSGGPSFHGAPSSAVGRAPQRDTLLQPSTSSLHSNTSIRSRGSSSHSKSPSSRTVQETGQHQRVDAFFAPRPNSPVVSIRSQLHGAQNPKGNTCIESLSNLEIADNKEQDCLFPAVAVQRIPAVPFKRPSVYAPTIASRQRTISSMLVAAGQKRKSVTAL